MLYKFPVYRVHAEKGDYMKQLRIAFAAAAFMCAGALYAEEPTRTAAGFTFDFLPTAVSAAAGHFGYSYQTWAGIDHLRMRLVGAQIYMPDRFIGSKRFDSHSLTVAAGIIDYVFGEHFDGAWIGTGVELWQNRIRCKSSGSTSEWVNQVLTAGGGYIFRVKGNFYVEPWGAVHVIMNQRPVRDGSASYTPQRVSAEVSLKAGYFFDI